MPDDDPIALFNESLSRVLRRQPRLGRFARFPVLPLPDDAVAATDGWRFYAGPRLPAYAPEERDAIIMHEMVHVLLSHPSRCRKLAKEYTNVLPDVRTIANNAVDYVANLLVVDAGETLPADALIDERYINKGLTDVFHDVASRAKTPPPWGEDVTREPGDEKGDGKPEQGNGDGTNPSVGDGGFSEAEAEAILRAVTGRAQPVPVHVWLQRKFLRGTTKRGSWERPSRFGPLVPGRKIRRGDKIVICVDTSGSINDTTQALFRRIAAGIPHAASTDILFADIRVRSRVLDIRNPDEIPAAWRHCAGGGGTSFDSALREARELNPSHVIYLTDGEGNAPSMVEPLLNLTWIVWGKNHHYKPWRAPETVLFIDDAGNVTKEGGA